MHRVFWARPSKRKLFCMVEGDAYVRSSLAMIAVKLVIQCRLP